MELIRVLLGQRLLIPCRWNHFALLRRGQTRCLQRHRPGRGGWGTHLEHCEKRLREIIEGAPLGLRFVKIKLAAKQLHPQQREDDDEEKKQKQQRSNRLHGV